jgi:hypothetical protein
MARRTFLKHCASAGLGFATAIGLRDLVGERQASGAEATDGAAPYDGPYYVVFNASGGWDTTYLMDPKGIDGINRLYDQGEILTQGAHRYAPTAKHISAGVSNEDFFQRYGAELLVMHGIDLSVNNHTPCSRYMATGKLDSVAYPTFAALVAACRGPEAPLAFLTFGDYSATGNLVPMSRVPYLQSLNLLAKADFVHGNEGAPYHEPFIADRIERALEERFESRVAGAMLPRARRSESMLFAAQSNSKTLSRIVPYIPREVAAERLHQQCDIALAGFKAGVCVSANLTIGQFDSHSNNDTDQMKLIPEFLAGIDYLLKKSEELSIREKLVVVIQSEMGRTPTYNSGNGKDHWSINSIMFLGAGIAGNRVLGATDDKQHPVTIDPRTMMIDTAQGVRTRPEHVHQALRELAGIADHEFCGRFPLGVKPAERLHQLWG